MGAYKKTFVSQRAVYLSSGIVSHFSCRYPKQWKQNFQMSLLISKVSRAAKRLPAWEETMPTFSCCVHCFSKRKEGKSLDMHLYLHMVKGRCFIYEGCEIKNWDCLRCCFEGYECFRFTTQQAVGVGQLVNWVFNKNRKTDTSAVTHCYKDEEISNICRWGLKATIYFTNTATCEAAWWPNDAKL